MARRPARPPVARVRPRRHALGRLGPTVVATELIAVLSASPSPLTALPRCTARARRKGPGCELLALAPRAAHRRQPCSSSARTDPLLLPLCAVSSLRASLLPSLSSPSVARSHRRRAAPQASLTHPFLSFLPRNSVAELYGGWMTFAPGALSHILSSSLCTSARTRADLPSTSSSSPRTQSGSRARPCSRRRTGSTPTSTSSSSSPSCPVHGAHARSSTTRRTTRSSGPTPFVSKV